MRLAPGITVGPTRLVRLLAEGGMGSVWVADHLGLQTQVAVKFIAESVAEDATIMMRFEREARAAAHIKSPHVVQIFDHGMAEGRIPYIVMELLDGESLGRRLDRCGALSVRETAAIVGQVCRALSKAHASGVVHRDIKPDNIFLTDSDGELFVKVLDFGIAKRANDQQLGMTSTGMAVGTPLYMSPEQSVGAKDVTLSTDLWAVAAVAYRCVTGRVPFAGDTFGALCVAISRGEFPLPSQIHAGVPQAFDAWFARGLATVPAQRFASARELADQFSIVGGFPPGVQVSAPAALPPRSGSSSAAAVHADVARGPALTPASAKTVTVMTSDAQEALRNAAGTMQTGPSIAAASLGGRSTEDAVARSGRATKVALIAVLSAIVVAGALALVRNAAPKPSAPATTPSAQDAPIAMPAEDRAPAVDLGSSGATLPRPMEGASSEAERAGAERNEPAPAASAFGGAKPPLENRRKQGLSPPAQGISSGSGKPPVKNRPRLPPTAEPGRDLMEP